MGVFLFFLGFMYIRMGWIALFRVESLEGGGMDRFLKNNRMLRIFLGVLFGSMGFVCIALSILNIFYGVDGYR